MRLNELALHASLMHVDTATNQERQMSSQIGHQGRYGQRRKHLHRAALCCLLVGGTPVEAERGIGRVGGAHQQSCQPWDLIGRNGPPQGVPLVRQELPPAKLQRLRRLTLLPIRKFEAEDGSESLPQQSGFTSQRRL